MAVTWPFHQLQATLERRGTGRRLIVAAEARARAANTAGLFLTCGDTNVDAHVFYYGVGFELSPISPLLCAPDETIRSCDYHLFQKLWESARRENN